MSSAAAPDESLHARARELARTLVPELLLSTGESALAHADGVCELISLKAADDASLALPYLLAVWDSLAKPEQTIEARFGKPLRELVSSARALMVLQATTRSGTHAEASDAQLRREHAEHMRRLMLAFSQDLRVVLGRLASRLQTLRYFAQTKRTPPEGMARETLDVIAPVANRLGVWQYKWELEDLAFRFLEPQTYKRIAKLLDAKRIAREDSITQVKSALLAAFEKAGLQAQVSGRPKHIYSIYKKMAAKSLAFEDVMDVRALRVQVPRLKDCYTALSLVHAIWQPVSGEFDDYIARPKSNGYQSLHTVVLTDEGLPFEVQIRTQEMHEHAEYGVAAHWAYKEAGVKSAGSGIDQKIAIARQLLDMQSQLDLANQLADSQERIYVLTPQARIVELTAGATAVDFAYAVHTSLGHRCRGAKINGQMVPLNTPLATGQTVEVSTVKEGGPSRDWLNAELGFLKTPRAKSKVRAWFNALDLDATINLGRAAVEKLLQRLGKTAQNLEALAAKLGFKDANALFEIVGKDEYSLRNIEVLFDAPEADAEPALALQKSKADRKRGDVLVVGVGSLLTVLARCCKPVPGDAIKGFITRGKGVSVHRADCKNVGGLMKGERAVRFIDVTWGEPAQSEALYQVDVFVEAQDRQGLLRDLSEVFSKDRINLIGVQSQSIKEKAVFTFTVELKSLDALPRALTQLKVVRGVSRASRK